MRQVILFVSAVLFLIAGCSESEALLPSADTVPTSESPVSPPSTDLQADLANQAIRDFTDAFNKHDWTAASRFVPPLTADVFRDGVEHAAQNQAQLQLKDVTVRGCTDDSCNFSVRWSMSPEGYCNPLFGKSGSGLSVINVYLVEGKWVLRPIVTFGTPAC